MKKYFNNIWLGIYTTLIGMKITFGHLFQKKVTIQYPDERYPIPDTARNRLYVNMDDCIGCNQCSNACPVNCISIETVKSLATEDLGTTSTGQKKRLWVTKFDIDFAKCCFCGLCTFPCPTECIKMTTFFEYSEYSRRNFLYSFVALTPEEIQAKKDQLAVAEKEAAVKKAAAAAAVKPAEPAASKPDINTETKTS
jgi:NADH-quinone oxidoreductase subunit I